MIKSSTSLGRVEQTRRTDKAVPSAELTQLTSLQHAGCVGLRYISIITSLLPPSGRDSHLQCAPFFYCPSHLQCPFAGNLKKDRFICIETAHCSHTTLSSIVHALGARHSMGHAHCQLYLCTHTMLVAVSSSPSYMCA